MKARRIAWLVFSLNAACATEQLQMEPPPIETDTSAIVIHVARGATELVQAFRYEGPRSFAFPLSALEGSGEVVVTLLTYSESLVDLGWEEGFINPAAMSESCARLEPTKVWTAGLVDGLIDDWDETPIPPAVQPFLQFDNNCVPTDRCGTFGLPIVTAVPADDWPRILEPWNDGFLVGTGDGDFFELNRDGEFTPRDNPFGLKPINGSQDSAGAIWMGGKNGVIRRLETDGSVNTFDLPEPLNVAGVRASPNRQNILAVTTKFFDSNPEPEMYRMQFFLRSMTSTTWNRVHTTTVSVFDPSGANLAWLNDDVAYVSYGGGDLFKVRYGGVEVERDLPQTEAVDSHSRLGVLVSTRTPAVLRSDPTGWLLVSNAEIGLFTKAFVETPEGFVVGNRNGVVRQVVVDGAACPAQAVAGGPAQKMRRNGNVLAMTGQAFGDGGAVTVVVFE